MARTINIRTYCAALDRMEEGKEVWKKGRKYSRVQNLNEVEGRERKREKTASKTNAIT